MRVLLSVCALALVAPRAARADGAGVIAPAGRDRAAVAAAMAAAMAGHGRVVVDAVAEARGALAAGAVPPEALARFRRVREQIDEGWRAYLRVAVDNAHTQLAAARADAEPLLALPGGAELYADATLRLGVVLGHLGRRVDAQALLRLARALDPDRPIALAEFSPDVVEAVESARQASAPAHRLRIETAPAGASIRVDGTDAGRTPIELDLTAGPHAIVARAPDHRTAVRVVVAGSPGAAPLTLELARDDAAAHLSAGAPRGLSASAAQALVDAVLRYADLDEVALVTDATRRGEPTLLVQRCAGLPARCTSLIELGYRDRADLAAAARAAWQAARSADLREPPTVFGEPEDRPTPAARCSLCRNPWLWTGVGAAVVTGLIVTFIAVSGDKPPPVVGVDPSQF